MKAKYCIVPDKNKFFAFLAEQSLTEAELLRARLIQPEKIFMDIEAAVWQIEYKAVAPVTETLLAAVANKLTAAFNLKKVELQQTNLLETSVVAESVKTENKLETENKSVQVEPEREEIPLPPEEPEAVEIGEAAAFEAVPSCEAERKDDAYEKAYNLLYGGNKKADGLIFGKAFKGKPRPMIDVIEEENRVVVEGTFVKSIDKDGKLTAFIERVLRTGNVMLTFNLSDETSGLYVRMRFENLEECLQFKKKIKPRMQLRIMGNVAPDRFLFDEMVISPQGIIAVPKKERMDNAEVKRVELHCHTKMSKMDGVTPMEDLVETAIKWGHKALAITDHGVVQAFPFCFDVAEKADIKLIFGMEGYLMNDDGHDIDLEPTDTIKKSRIKKVKNNHIIILAKNETGLRNLYKLVTISHLRYLHKRPMLPREVIEEYREGLILGSACEAGELYRAILAGRPDEELEKIASFYDYLEIQPTGNNMFLVRQERCTVKQLQEHNRKIYELGKKLGKLTVATCDVHFLHPEDAQLRAILQAGQNYSDADQQAPLYFRTTEEMLKEFEYFGKEIAYELCVTNPNKIAEMVEKIKPVPDRDQLYSPFIPGAEKAIKEMSYQRAHEWYGENLPQVVSDRLKMELDSIINHGFSVLYYIAHKLVRKSLDDGYLVGSRGSVGSSFVATMIDITEVNPLKPHYRCPQCKHSEFFMKEEVASGFDLPAKACPECCTEMIRDGHDIPFAVFMGFHGDKVPDIDLNFSGDYQPTAHKYTEELFGRDNVCRAGTISTIAIKTAFGYVKKYYEAKNLHVHSAHVAGLVEGFAGIKRTTGQHPGGIMVVPRNMDIHYISPMNRPADEKDSETVTTHFDYHSINDRLVKLDILGHDDPTVIKMLEELTNIPPQQIPVGDEKTMSIFRSTEAFGVTPEQIGSAVGTYGIPECGTQFVRQMIQDVQPKNFSQVVRVSGYSHGTDVWLNNAQDLIREGKPSEETISTRDDIMTNLIAKGVDPSMSFKIMEYVRKGKAAKGGLEAPMLEAMRAAKVPEWYIESCNKVQYLFPKAHAVAYVMMAYRIAYCKVHYPREFYAAYFTVRAPDFDMDHVVKGVDYMKRYIKDVYAQGYKASNRDKDTVTYLELVIEMLARGFEMERIDLYKSHPTRFTVTEKGLRPPLAALGGIGVTAAQSISEAREIGHPFISQEDLRVRAKVGKAVVEKLAEHGALGDLPETDQIDLF
ncbi:PolC-type DNA polymerase III [Phascolarctobacterium faecium]|uniref:PolC-type DNA polymerase III n=1 Tax=Phascolarctobacterium faecium TaxID=33025 RepID=UPI003FF10F23